MYLDARALGHASPRAWENATARARDTYTTYPSITISPFVPWVTPFLVLPQAALRGLLNIESRIEV